MATKEEQGSFDFEDAKEINTKHQAELSKQMIKDLADKKIDMEEFRERAKNLTVGKPGKEAREAKTSGLSKSTGKGGGAGGAGGFEDPMKKGVTNKMPSMKKGGHIEHKDMVKKHAAGFKHHSDHVKAMCGGGYMGKKK